MTRRFDKRELPGDPAAPKPFVSFLPIPLNRPPTLEALKRARQGGGRTEELDRRHIHSALLNPNPQVSLGDWWGRI